jgi:hypothetical protein
MVVGGGRQDNPHMRDSVATDEVSAESRPWHRATEEAGALGYEFE